ncbi:TPA: hypothetical protein DCR79_00915 [Patescibacteria group bacterium]|nr:hypothetical protein [Patescibacteria group bacterium]
MQTDKFHLGIKALIFNKQNQVLLLQVNIKQLTGEIREYWDIPGGRIHRGETVDETLKREVREETGLSVEKYELFDTIISNIRIPISTNEDVGLILFVYKCTTIMPALVVLSNEHVAYKWFSLQEATDLLAIKYPEQFTRTLMLTK